MITVKLYGLIRIESGIREKQLDSNNIRELFDQLSHCGISKKDLSGCIILINGVLGSKRSKLSDGDTVMLMPPVAGG